MAERPASEKVQLPAEDAYQLIRSQAIAEVQGELEQWGRRRFWFITTILSLVGFFGGSVLIKTVVESSAKNPTKVFEACEQ